MTNGVNFALGETMSDVLPVQFEEEQAAPGPGPGVGLSLRHVRQALTVLVVVCAVIWLLYLLSTHNALGDAWTTQVMLCAVALLAAAWGTLHRHHHWTVPLRHLRE